MLFATIKKMKQVFIFSQKRPFRPLIPIFTRFAVIKDNLVEPTRSNSLPHVATMRLPDEQPQLSKALSKSKVLQGPLTKKSYYLHLCFTIKFNPITIWTSLPTVVSRSDFLLSKALKVLSKFIMPSL